MKKITIACIILGCSLNVFAENFTKVPDEAYIEHGECLAIKQLVNYMNDGLKGDVNQANTIVTFLLDYIEEKGHQPNVEGIEEYLQFCETHKQLVEARKPKYY